MEARAARAALAATDLAGTWLLRDWTLLLDDGRTVTPFGARPQGVVVYTLEGRMVTTIGAPGRDAGEADLVSGTDAARRSAVETFIAYAGTYRVEGGEVIHAVEMSLEPRWVGTEQRRQVRLSPDGSQLTLSTGPLLVAGRMGRHRLTWERAPSLDRRPA